LDFFEKKGHRVVPSSSLIPTDPSVLFTTAGMQQFKPYYLGEKSPYGPNVTSCQKCFRTSDIEKVGDNRHLTFLEMLGNFSFGDYFKEEAIKLALEFLIANCKLQIDQLKFTYFKGDKEVPGDIESKRIWLKLGIPENKIVGMNREDNFWGPTGLEGPCGPTTEIHAGELEIWNLVFNEYYQDRKRSLVRLSQKGVDTGMGLERLAMVSQGKSSVYETDLFEPILREITSPGLVKARRIIADHIKGSVFLISEGILPSNVERGYVLRRILRRAIRFGKLLNLPKNFLIFLAQKTIEIYKDTYPEVKSKETDILTIIQNEGEKFEKTLEKGLSQFEKLLKLKTKLPFMEAKVEKRIKPSLTMKNEKLKIISGEEAFDLYQSYGFPLELTEEMAKEKGFKIDKESFFKAQRKHQEISRVGVEKKFGGTGKDADYQATKLHTTTHLLQAALREVLGNHVKQMGSDITSQRLRFDFAHSKKLTEEEIKRIEEIVNQKIKENLEIKKTEMSPKQAIESGALAFFKEKYPEKVTVYTIGNPSDPSGQVFSKEICAGPHVNRTLELGHFKIVKEESIGVGKRRIRAILK